MEIPSSFASGVAGLQSAQSGLTQATVDVAKPSTNQATATDSNRPVESTDKTQALVSALESGQQAEAAVEVIEASNETLGTIIDLEV
ncbi:chemotaxis protein [Shewanella waksmanii]|uniref:chemotaxis protein n=1 Tax=Shewanella waksmanii TaxID=213783 RepID=UPI003734F239